MGCRGFPHWKIGEVQDVPAGDAMVLLSLGGAEPAEDEPKSYTKERLEIIESREPVVESRDPVVAPVKRLKKTLP
jgi:hypothetical protein